MPTVDSPLPCRRAPLALAPCGSAIVRAISR
jgi:hypothetical protein